MNSLARLVAGAQVVALVADHRQQFDVGELAARRRLRPSRHHVQRAGHRAWRPDPCRERPEAFGFRRCPCERTVDLVLDRPGTTSYLSAMCSATEVAGPTFAGAAVARHALRGVHLLPPSPSGPVPVHAVHPALHGIHVHGEPATGSRGGDRATCQKDAPASGQAWTQRGDPAGGLAAERPGCLRRAAPEPGCWRPVTSPAGPQQAVHTPEPCVAFRGRTRERNADSRGRLRRCSRDLGHGRPF